MAQILAIHTNDLYEPRVRSRDVIADALAAKLITTTPRREPPTQPKATSIPDDIAVLLGLTERNRQ